MKLKLPVLLKEIAQCRLCEDQLPLGPNPVVSLHKKSKILLVGQAPGLAVHRSGIPWDDASGKRLRTWLGVDEASFYDPVNFGIVPMAFCYPGKAKSGDLPPSKQCAPQWHEALRSHLDELQMILLIGTYAQKYYLGKQKKKNLTTTVMHFEEYLPRFFPIVHPSPLNYRWISRNSWFEKDVVPELQRQVKKLINTD